MKIASKCNWRNVDIGFNINAPKRKKTQNESANIYLKEQREFIQNQIHKNRDSVEDRQYGIAWQTINEVSKKKSTAKSKLRATSHEERIYLWKQEFTRKISENYA